MINNLIPIFSIFYFLFFLKSNRLNNVLTSLIFISFFVFATNYIDIGLEIDIFRYLHRIIGVLAAIALVYHIFRNRINFFKELVPRILALFFLVLLLSFIGNDIYAEYYAHYVRNFIFISSIVVYLYYMLDSKEKLEELMSLIVAITLILSCFVVLEVVQNGWGNKIKLFYSNNSYLAYALFLGFICSFNSQSKYKWFGLCLITFAIFATSSRAVELSVVFSTLVYVYSRQYKLVYLAPGLLVVIAVLVLFFEQIVSNQHISNVRYMITKITLNVFQENPINGIGYGQFRKKFHHYIDEDIFLMSTNEISDAFFINNPNSPLIKNSKYEAMSESDKEFILSHVNRREKMTHNDVLTIVADLGLLGIACTVFLFYKLYIELQKLILHNRGYFFFSIELIGGSLIFSLFHNNLTSFVFWFVLFIPFIMNRNYIKTR